jgi:hypothetical protein
VHKGFDDLMTEIRRRSGAVSRQTAGMDKLGKGKVPNSVLRLSRAEWARVLKEARRIAADMAVRKRHLQLEGGSPEDLLSFDRSATQYIRDRVEVHIGTIGLMRHLRVNQEPLVRVPAGVRIGLEELIGPEAIREVLK